jgi:SAM-dependent methyltransferase
LVAAPACGPASSYGREGAESRLRPTSRTSAASKVVTARRTSPKRGGLPPRYDEHWREPFAARISSALFPGTRILDVGSGAFPTVPIADRPPGCVYAGFDLSFTELQRAPSGSYDEYWVADVSVRVPALDDRFDLVVSCNLLEHVQPIDRAFENLRAYLLPGGRLLAVFSGSFSVFGILNRIIPRRVGVKLMERLLGRDPKNVYPACYDRCSYDEIVKMLNRWERAEVVPLYLGAEYFNFSSALRSSYLWYENWAWRTRRRNLATHYLVNAVR